MKLTLALLFVALLLSVGCKKKEAAAPATAPAAALVVQSEKNTEPVDKTKGSSKVSLPPAMQRVPGTTNKIPMVP